MRSIVEFEPSQLSFAIFPRISCLNTAKIVQSFDNRIDREYFLKFYYFVNYPIGVVSFALIYCTLAKTLEDGLGLAPVEPFFEEVLVK